MQIVNVPAEHCPPRIVADINRAYGWNIEQHFHEWLVHNYHTCEDSVNVSYLPVYWWNNAVIAYRNRSRDGFHAIEATQRFVDSLPLGVQYATVSRGADGIYERMPKSAVVFSAGGGGHFPIPHLCEIERHMTAPLDKKLLASFVGNLTPGGPEIPRPPGRSSRNPNGAGTRVRQAMVKAFEGDATCQIIDQHMVSWSEKNLDRHRHFCDIAADSWFGLAPRGYGKTSYRLYEMFSLGSIPVYIYDEPWLPYLDKLDWTEFAVLCHESELPGLPDRLRAISIEQRLAMLDRASALFESYFTPDGVCRQIMRYMELL